MDWRERLQGLRRFQPAALSLEDAGSWPIWAKSTAMLLAAALAMAAGYPWLLAPGRERLALAQLEEAELRRAYQRNAARFAALSAYQGGDETPEPAVTELLRQLPREVEIPGLLDDITAAAKGHGLVVRSLDLKPEQAAGFFAELPMEITVEGGFHEIGAFVSRVAGLPRIVTLHDFDLESGLPEAPADRVRMQLTTRIYRRLDEPGGKP